MDSNKWTTVVDMRPTMRAINTHILVLEKPKAQQTSMGLVYTLLVADQTGSIQFTLFNEVGTAVRAGDILELTGGYCNLFKSKILTLYVGQGDRGSLKKCGEFTMIYREVPNMSDFRWEFPEAGNMMTGKPLPPNNAQPPFLVPNMNGPGLIPYVPLNPPVNNGPPHSMGSMGPPRGGYNWGDSNEGNGQNTRPPYTAGDRGMYGRRSS